jgi:hypothetical protein
MFVSPDSCRNDDGRLLYVQTLADGASKINGAEETCPRDRAMQPLETRGSRSPQSAGIGRSAASIAQIRDR